MGAGGVEEACIKPVARVLPPVSMSRVPIRYRWNGAARSSTPQVIKASRHVVPPAIGLERERR
jgi:hypothetical protein